MVNDALVLSPAEDADVRHRLAEASRMYRWMTRWFLFLLILLFGYFAVRLLLDEVGLVGIVLAVLTVGLIVLLIRWGFSPIETPDRLDAVVVEGVAEHRMLKLDKYRREHRLFVDDVPTQLPDHWRGAVNDGQKVRVRAAAILDQGGKILSAPLQVVAIEGGPSIEFENAEEFGHRPSLNYGAIIGLIATVLPAIVMIGATVSHLNTRYAALPEAIGAVKAIPAARIEVADGDALIAAGPSLGPVSVAEGWILPAKLVENIEAQAQDVLITDAARDRLLTDREPIARAWRDTWAVYQADYAAYQNALRTVPPISADEPFSIASIGNRPRPPALPLPAKVDLNAGELVALTMKDPRGGGTSFRAGEIEPVIASLQQREPFSGTVLSRAEMFPVRLHSKRVADDHRDTGLGLFAGIAALVLSLLFLLVILKKISAQKRFKVRVRGAYAVDGISI